MCGRYSLAAPEPGTLRARFALGESLEIRPRYNVAPGDDVLAVTTDREGRARSGMLRWGLVPSWAKGPDTGLKMINARVETVSERPAYRRAFERHRCLIPADGFYEWRRRPDGTGSPKQPFHITRADGEPFAFAGLWSVWHAANGDALRTCTIITTAANEAIVALHDRMPVILAPGDEAAWLNTDTPREQLDQVLVGLPAAETALTEVGFAVNDARYDGPDCLAAPVPSAQTSLF